MLQLVMPPPPLPGGKENGKKPTKLCAEEVAEGLLFGVGRGLLGRRRRSTTTISPGLKYGYTLSIQKSRLAASIRKKGGGGIYILWQIGSSELDPIIQ